MCLKEVVCTLLEAYDVGCLCFQKRVSGQSSAKHSPLRIDQLLTCSGYDYVRCWLHLYLELKMGSNCSVQGGPRHAVSHSPLTVSPPTTAARRTRWRSCHLCDCARQPRRPTTLLIKGPIRINPRLATNETWGC
jgi:hypothetical protein